MTRKTQLEVAELTTRTSIDLADAAFQPKWREKMVRPFLDVIAGRWQTIADISEAFTSAEEVGPAHELLAKYSMWDTQVHIAAIAALGDEELTLACEVWSEHEYSVITELGKLVSYGSEEQSEQDALQRSDAVDMRIRDLMRTTARVQHAATSYVANGALGSGKGGIGPWLGDELAPRS